mgnify:CR=1 FL=1
MTLRNTTSAAQETDLPISSLVPARNIRQAPDRSALDEMKASLLSTGQLQNLCAAPQADGTHAVFAGATRLVAAQELVAEGTFSPDMTLRCLVFDGLDPTGPEAITIAATENMIRADMDYIDECLAMAELAKNRRSEDEIAAIFGYRRRTVTERLLIAQLIPEAHKLVREGTRTLDWARALTVADQALQKQICEDITANPDSWQTGQDIRTFLNKSTIPAAHALFDMAEYKGEIIRDMFDGDKISDIDAFWTLQNDAIKALKSEIEAEGFRDVHVLREPFQAWRYEDCSDPARASAFIEVMPNGQVNVIRNKALIEEETTKTAALDDDSGDVAHEIEEIADDEVRATPSMCAYAAQQRSAMLQATLADSPRMAMEYTVLAFLGHRGATFGGQTYSFPGDHETRVGKAFSRMATVFEDIHEATAVTAASPELRETQIVAMVRSMDDSALEQLFTHLVALRAGQHKRRSLDTAESALTNVFGAEIDVRVWWTPDEAFFNLMGSEDLRRLATALLPGASATRFATAQRKNLVKALASNFADARDGVLGGDVAQRLNAWVPGVMSFPAHVAMKAPDDDPVFTEDADETDLDALLFEEA